MRKWYALALGVVLLMAGALVPILFPRPCPVTREAFKGVQHGMSKVQVEAIMRGPPGDYRTGPGIPILLKGSRVIPVAEAGHVTEIQVWECDEGHLEVWFTDGAVDGKVVDESTPVAISSLDRAL